MSVGKLYSRKAAYDRYATTLEDVDSSLPLTHLHRFAAEGRIGAVAPRFQVIHSEYSQRKTLTVDAPEILKRMRETTSSSEELAAYEHGLGLFLRRRGSPMEAAEQRQACGQLVRKAEAVGLAPDAPALVEARPVLYAAV